MVVQSAEIAGATTVGGTLAAVWTVAHGTQFGHVVLLRFVLLLVAVPLLGARGWRLAVALLLSGAALAMQGGVGHAGATGGAVGAAAGLGGAASAGGGGLARRAAAVVPPGGRAAAACRVHHLPQLHACRAVCRAADRLHGRGAGWQLIGSLGGLFGTAYGRTALLKLGMFLVLLVLAVINRFVLTDRLHGSAQPVATRLLRTSLAVEAVLGVMVIMVAAFLASGTPGTHETPIWPFSRQPSLELLYDPFGRELLLRTLAAQPYRRCAGGGRAVLAPAVLAGAGGVSS